MENSLTRWIPHQRNLLQTYSHHLMPCYTINTCLLSAIKCDLYNMITCCDLYAVVWVDCITQLHTVLVMLYIQLLVN